MKIRNGLVSNSSSSSFMCTFGKIIDMEKFETWAKKNKFKFNTVKGEKLATALDRELHQVEELSNFFVGLNGDFFDYMPSIEEVCMLAQKDPEATYVLCGGYGDGEDSFYWNEDSEEYDYDNVYNDSFPSIVEELFCAAEDEGFESIEGCCYAGRDG